MALRLGTNRDRGLGARRDSASRAARRQRPGCGAMAGKSPAYGGAPLRRSRSRCCIIERRRQGPRVMTSRRSSHLWRRRGASRRFSPCRGQRSASGHKRAGTIRAPPVSAACLLFPETSSGRASEMSRCSSLADQPRRTPRQDWSQSVPERRAYPVLRRSRRRRRVWHDRRVDRFLLARRCVAAAGGAPGPGFSGTAAMRARFLPGGRIAASDERGDRRLASISRRAD